MINFLSIAALAGIVSLQGAVRPATMDDAQRAFFNARYEDAAALALARRAGDPSDLAAYELRMSALHFQIRRAMGDAEDKDKAFKQCAACPDLLSAFLSEFTRGRALAQDRVRAAPEDDDAAFFLGKIDLNYVWLQLGTLGKRTGWNEYWEARRSLDAVLKRQPGHVRARVARAWIDYIVDTRMPRGFRWVLGGGDKKRGLQAIQDAATAEADDFARTEAGFALWDLQAREKNYTAAVATARRLAEEFPENRELANFITRHTPEERQ